MKDVGVVRKLDNLGRIVVPVEMRKTLDISLHDPVEIFVDGDTIILKKYHSQCVLCGGSEALILYHDKLLCRNCLEEIREIP